MALARIAWADAARKMLGLRREVRDDRLALGKDEAGGGDDRAGGGGEIKRWRFFPRIA